MAAGRRYDWVDYARLASGALCLAAGIAKAFPQIEDVAETLRQMAQANEGTALAPLSNLIADNLTATIWLVAIALAASGLAFLFNRFVVPAALGQLVMFSLFVTLLFRFQPAIIAIDLPFIAVDLLVLQRVFQRRHGLGSAQKC
ncbi:DUF6041 domain-containing protein [Notoacmeibacter marinus]|uniref:DUF6041 domain-containing protein n=1 Tax=Notoacmeibacter marinus TaxID=1876515 RepID=UPI000DF223F0|nr:DUF6041 domain-containing protein [Notoacmeibacter marinus]